MEHLRSNVRVRLLTAILTTILLPTIGWGGVLAPDFASQAHNVLPAGNGNFGAPHATDQIPLYDGLTPLFDQVTTGDLDLFFKPHVFGPTASGPGSAEGAPLTPRPGVTVQYDNFGVPHITSDTREGIMFGAGWVQARDRWPIMFALRGAGKIAALDAPGYDPMAVAEGFGEFAPSAQTLAIFEAQDALLESKGPPGRQVRRDIDEYVAGVNAANAPLIGTSYRREDVLGAAAFVAATFGAGGGAEVRASQFLNALQERHGATLGRQIWDDLAEKNDGDAAVTIRERRFRYGSGPVIGSPGNAIVDDGSFEPPPALTLAAASHGPAAMSNALLFGPNLSDTGNPLFVAGPQTGYFSPQILYEMDLHGGGIDVRGVVFPGSGPYVVIGRSHDYAWSATSAGHDVVDQYVEKLCGDDRHYIYKRDCLEMEHVNAGTLTLGMDTIQVEFDQTVHGPVVGYATVGGERVAISQKRSTRGREGVNALGFAELNAGKATTARKFFRSAHKVEFTFNWFYVNDREAALFSSGRLPRRPLNIDWGLPTWGTGEWEWRTFLSRSGHPHVVNPRDGMLDNWNNKPALGFQSSDSQWGYGAVYRNLLLAHAQDETLPPSGKHTLASAVAAMNRAATQDLRATEIFPEIKNMLDSGTPPNATAAQMVDLLDQWVVLGGSRLDVEPTFAGDGLVDHPGAAIMDSLWPKLANAVMEPLLGPTLSHPVDLRDHLAGMLGRDNSPGQLGSAFQGGWYSYVDEDLRNVKPMPSPADAVIDPFQTKFCGAGDVGDCAASLWQAIDDARAELETAQGPDPSLWRADADAERIMFGGLPIPDTMRWTNRPTFQQVISFDSHR